MKETGEAIEEFLSNSLDLEEKFILESQILCRDLKQDNILNPFNLFIINNGAFMSIVATALTYIVVLVQFKTTELPLKA